MHSNRGASNEGKRVSAFKRVEYGAGSAAVRLVVGFARGLPRGWVHGFAALLGRAGYYGGRRYRRIALGNLRLVFGGEQTERSLKRKALERLAVRNYQHISESFCEAVRAVLEGRSTARERIRVRGVENLESAFSGGRGVLVVTGHMGNFGLIGYRLAMEGYPFNLVFRYPEAPGAAASILGILESQHVRVISAVPRHECVAQCLERLRANELVCLLIDQREGDAGVDISFLGRPSRAAAGPALLALRTGAAVVPVFMTRESTGRHRLDILAALEQARKGTLRSDVEAFTGRINRVLEERIRLHPEQWWWMHRRWKDA